MVKENIEGKGDNIKYNQTIEDSANTRILRLQH